MGFAVGYGLIRYGNRSIFYDISEEVLRKIREKGYQVSNNLEKLIQDTDIIFICVPSENTLYEYDDSIIFELTHQLRRVLRTASDSKILVYKSTVLPGTMRKVADTLGNMRWQHFLVYNPEFSRERSAINDFLHPDRIVIGIEEKIEEAKRILNSIYLPFGAPMFYVSFPTAEIVKLWSNIALATRISLTNFIGRICEKIDVEPEEASRIVHMDRRLGDYGSEYGRPFAGKCLPKDLKAFIQFLDSIGIDSSFLREVRKVNVDMGGR